MTQNVQDMMSRFDEVHARYKGVRGELLAKVRAELVKPGASTTKELLARFDSVAAKYKGVRGELLAKVREHLTGDAPGAAVVTKPAAAVVTKPAAAVVTKPAAVTATKPVPAVPLAAVAAAKVAVALQPQASIDSVRQLRRTTPEQKAAVASMLPSCRVCGRGMKPAGSGTLTCEKGHVRNVAS
ncbi:MAG: hypothetical protein INH41_29940 [Myxococcaceae bacterium]|jgi:hypothetical protein|nr:hypothetical protein [Myxococcaceae bacterium]